MKEIINVVIQAGKLIFVIMPSIIKNEAIELFDNLSTIQKVLAGMVLATGIIVKLIKQWIDSRS